VTVLCGMIEAILRPFAVYFNKVDFSRLGKFSRTLLDLVKM